MRVIEDLIFIVLLIALPDCLLDKLGIYESAYRIVNKRRNNGSTVVLMDDITYEKKYKKGENDGSRN